MVVAFAVATPSVLEAVATAYRILAEPSLPGRPKWTTGRPSDATVHWGHPSAELKALPGVDLVAVRAWLPRLPRLPPVVGAEVDVSQSLRLDYSTETPHQPTYDRPMTDL
jgi:hypothetical protein